jgi:hypothetical protein
MALSRIGLDAQNVRFWGGKRTSPIRYGNGHRPPNLQLIAIRPPEAPAPITSDNFPFPCQTS